MTTDSGNELADCLSSYLRPLNDIDDNVATSSAEINYEDFEEFKNSTDLTFFEQDCKEILKELKKKAEKVVASGEKCDIRNVFEESGIGIMKFNLFIWYFLENGRKSDSSEESVENGVYAASCYVAMCACVGASTDLYQVGLYNLCLKITRNCCHTVRIGEMVGGAKKMGGAKKKKGVAAKKAEPEPEEADAPVIGPPRISIDSAERFLNHLSTQFFGFLHGNTFSIDAQTLMMTMEMIEDLGRIDLDLRTISRACRANSVREFRGFERFTDRYSAFVNVLIESKYQTRAEMAYGRLIRPRLALMPYPDESSKSSKISTERKRAGELAVNILLFRLSNRHPNQKEMHLINTIIIMIYSQCPDLSEFRQNIAQFIWKCLEAMPYAYAYDFVQLMSVMSKTRGGGVKALSNELASVLLGMDWGRDDPGPLEEAEPEEGAEPEEEEPEEEEPEQEESDDDEDMEIRPKKTTKTQKSTKKPSKTPEIARKSAISILYNIVYLACIDKSPSMRLHGANSLAKILDSEVHRIDFQKFCREANQEMDKMFGEEEELTTEGAEPPEEPKEPKEPAKGSKMVLVLEDNIIVHKYKKLKKLDARGPKVENDMIFMILRRLATDEKAPVKKASCALLKSFLQNCEALDEKKFDTILTAIQKLCRDKMVSVRKQAAEAFTDVMLSGKVVFKETLGSKWLHSLISMLNDTDNVVTEHARILIMKVLTPLLETPSDLTWTLLDTIESVTNHRQYLMTTLKDAVREKLVKKTVMESMKTHIKSSGNDSDGKLNGAWMVFSQLCVQFEANVDFAIAELSRVDLTQASNLVQYMVHVIENNIERIDAETKKTLVETLKDTFRDFCLHSSHARSLYHCLGKLMDGIGDKAQYPAEFQSFGDVLLTKCFDTIVESFEMFKDKDEWKRESERQERLLIVCLNVATEVFSYSPKLIPAHERLGKTLALIVNSTDCHGGSGDAAIAEINPDMPSDHHTRPPTAVSEVASSQKTTSGGIMSHEGVLFSDQVRAVSVVTLANMILAHDRLLKLMPMLVKQLQHNPSHQIRSNIVVAMGDICASFKTDRYAPMLAASICDPSVLVRRHAINQIARLISYGIFRFKDEIMIRMMLATLDADEDVRNDAKLYISEVLQSEDPKFFKDNFVQYMLAVTQARRLIGCNENEMDDKVIDVAIGGGISLAKSSRIAIYTFMIESLDDRMRFDVKISICERIFTRIVNGEYDFASENTQNLLDDALMIMSSNEMQVKMDVGKDPNENALEDPSPEVIEAAAGFMQKVYLDHYMKTIVPSILALREFLSQHRSPLLRKSLLAIRMICMEHKNDIDEILQDNRQLKEEMMFELQRVKQRNEEAHRILDDYLNRVKVHQEKERAEGAPDGSEDVEMAEQEENGAPKTPEKRLKNPAIDQLKTPGNALRSRTEEQLTPRSRLLSPTTMRKIRRSVGALINSEMCLNALSLEDTVVEGAEPPVKEGGAKEKTIREEEKPEGAEPIQEEEELKEAEPKEKTIREEEEPEGAEPLEKEKTIREEAEPIQEEEPKGAEPVQEEQEEEEPEERRRSRRRKTPTIHTDDDENESLDANGKKWKKPKISGKSPEKEANISSSNVTVRRSRRGRASEVASEVTSEDVVVPKQRKRKAVEEDSDEPTTTPPTSSELPSEDVRPLSRVMTPMLFDETKVGGRFCSTPIRGRDSDTVGDVTFDDVNLSAITENEPVKNRKSHAQYLQQIFEEDEEN